MPRARSLVLAGLVLGVAGAAWQARRLWRATTMEDDHAAYWRRRRRSPGDVLLVALGDSLAQGLGALHPERSWAGRLADAVETREGVRVRVVNLGVVGATAADVRARQLPEVPDLGPGALVALAVGTNDAAQDVAPEDYRRDLDAVCAALPAGALVADVPDLQRGEVRARGMRLAEVAREVVAVHPELVPVALEAATHGLRVWEAGPDLAHPNGRGYRRYGRAFVEAWERSREQRTRRSYA
ncbi:SGNH/GDSL hydrolase family protein [Actinomycetospora cinnamomea]|uniref:Lysophospholipase L1-like esterase n=1 Tax=Actinomycetospora cinnamomea TaxID=663609 RepID=A0A2U1ECN9_9PSEU|nr:SGNH/GDSL hydrolase family protein [Actinomycetospora cinnamomea]PVY97726.1 lysophospholipase L1-like esterase [Actinomycetospora cinnamomea]